MESSSSAGNGAAPVAGRLNITDKTVVQIEKGIQTVIDAVADAGGGTVTVTGNKTDVDSSLFLDVKRNVTVIWKAEYTGNIMSGSLIDLSSGDGTFNVATGARIEVTCKDVWGTAISSRDTGIVISGGTVEAIGNTTVSAIESEKGIVTVDGGKVDAMNTGRGVGYAVKTRSGDVTVNGGVVEVTGDGSYGIYTVSGNITKNGGTVRATGAESITMYSMKGMIRDNTAGRKFIYVTMALAAIAALALAYFVFF